MLGSTSAFSWIVDARERSSRSSEVNEGKDEFEGEAVKGGREG